MSKAEEVALLRPLEATWAQVFGPCGCGVGAEAGVFDMDGTKAKALGLIWKKRGVIFVSRRFQHFNNYILTLVAMEAYLISS